MILLIIGQLGNRVNYSFLIILFKSDYTCAIINMNNDLSDNSA